MREPPERLFRDETGAAFERAARLEDENQELRAEIARIKQGHPRPSRDATTVRTRRSQVVTALLGVGAGLVVLGTMAMVLAARPNPRRSVAVLQPRPVTPMWVPPPGPTLAVAPAPTVAVDEDDCSTPYWYDTARVKHYKAACIHPDRAARQTE